ncbi:acyl-CoA thioesterase [Parahaliea aestuarii]|uniref:Acyl-CoA thioesterase n=1 Tax=Parahaliea aestuarii TaxID=1852021 RepID=A0A5C9A279_9GAMM|nr:acyl-CoA thioesterase domain-containing protein [Parahaliea aestuarii]TXS93451.1 acyl-CoA thioesterase [Parahaliea aestuarii]
MSSPFLTLEPTGNKTRWRMPVTADVCVGASPHVFMFGGVGLGAAALAAELTTGRETVWVSAQFLSYARIGDTLELEVEELNRGFHVSQVRVMAKVAGNPILTATAALGEREGIPEDQWSVMPSMPAPEDCVAQPAWPTDEAKLMDRLDIRVAPDSFAALPMKGRRSDDGRTLMWARAREGAALNTDFLGVLEDFVPSCLSAAFGMGWGGTSLDNTLRVLRRVPSEWVLCDVRISGSARGFAHGSIYMYAEDGSLVASGSQSMIQRYFDIELRR